jgi:hypothetical protein
LIGRRNRGCPISRLEAIIAKPGMVTALNHPDNQYHGKKRESQKGSLRMKKIYDDYSSSGFENAFFCFEDFTFRTTPGIGDIFPDCARRNSVFRISLYRIIDVMAFETHIPDQFY